MVRAIFGARVEFRSRDTNERLVANIDLAAAGLDQAVAIIDRWARQNNVDVAKHAALASVRKARRQESDGVLQVDWLYGALL